MSSITIPIKLLNETAIMPTKAFPTDAGWDVYANDDIVVGASQCIAIPLGIAVAIPAGYCLVLKERSGLALKSCIRIGGGVIDSSYRGEIKAIVHNLMDNKAMAISKGMKIAQMLVLPVPDVTFHKVDNLDETDRGTGGFGSSGQ